MIKQNSKRMCRIRATKRVPLVQQEALLDILFEQMQLDTIDLLIQTAGVCRAWRKASERVLFEKRALAYYGKEHSNHTVTQIATGHAFWRQYKWEQTMFWRAHDVARKMVRDYNNNGDYPFLFGWSISEEIVREQHYRFFVRVEKSQELFEEDRTVWHGFVPLQALWRPTSSDDSSVELERYDQQLADHFPPLGSTTTGTTNVTPKDEFQFQANLASARGAPRRGQI